MTITEFLEARIAEDEAQAEACRKLGWGIAEKYGITAISFERVLAECAAKRAILANVPRNSDFYDARAYTSAHTIYALAAIYADHPDYQQEWA